MDDNFNSKNVSLMNVTAILSTPHLFFFILISFVKIAPICEYYDSLKTATTLFLTTTIEYIELFTSSTSRIEIEKRENRTSTQTTPNSTFYRPLKPPRQDYSLLWKESAVRTREGLISETLVTPLSCMAILNSSFSSWSTL